MQAREAGCTLMRHSLYLAILCACFRCSDVHINAYANIHVSSKAACHMPRHLSEPLGGAVILRKVGAHARPGV
jgi:hypothetical protein